MARQETNGDTDGFFARVIRFFTTLAGLLTAVAAIMTATVAIIGVVVTRDEGMSSSPSNAGPLTPSTELAPGAATETRAARGKTFTEIQGQLGAPTFADPYGSAERGPKVPAGARVQVSCKVYAPSIPSASPAGYWYLLASPPWSNRYYAVANTFMNGGTLSGSGVRHVDRAVPDC